MNEVNEVYEALIDEYGVSEEALQLITNINGYSMYTLNEVIYSIFGYRSLEQMKEEEVWSSLKQ